MTIVVVAEKHPGHTWHGTTQKTIYTAPGRTTVRVNISAEPRPKDIIGDPPDTDDIM